MRRGSQPSFRIQAWSVYEERGWLVSGGRRSPETGPGQCGHGDQGGDQGPAGPISHITIPEDPYGDGTGDQEGDGCQDAEGLPVPQAPVAGLARELVGQEPEQQGVQGACPALALMVARKVAFLAT